MQLQYLIDKIANAEFQHSPFRHIQINSFFNDTHLKAILSAREIALRGAGSDQDLFSLLFENEYKVIDFPGCITDWQAYLKWHQAKATSHVTNTACEGFGITLRLMKPKSGILTEIAEFISSREFLKAIADKFEVSMADVFSDNGIQKYLDGYEISPHPDIRRKALTYMVNVNPDPQSEQNNHHTHYMAFREEFQYVKAYWEGNPGKDRCWVPWNWCDTKKMQRENNSIVIFSPSNDTLHAVKAAYNHLVGQRTQIYGNFWYNTSPTGPGPKWEDFVVRVSTEATEGTRSKIGTLVPRPIKELILGKKSDKNVANRFGRS